jgi:hypothetical protein
MDISTSKSVAEREDEGTIVHVRDEAGEKQYIGGDKTKPVTILVAGTYSTTYRTAADASRDRMLKQRRNAIDGDQLSQQSLELTAACILAWDGFSAGDQPYPFTKKNAVALLQQAPWIREQVEAAMNDHASFLR